MDPLLLLAFGGLVLSALLSLGIAIASGRMILILRAAAAAARRSAERSLRRRTGTP